jgi:hypothetical protein
MQTGNREQMREPGIAHGHERFLGDPAALADHEGRRDAARCIVLCGGDPFGQTVPELTQPKTQAAARRARRRFDQARRPEGVARAADPLEIGASGKIEGAGSDRLEGRRQDRPEIDPNTRDDRIALLAQGDANPFRRRVRVEPLDRDLLQEESLAARDGPGFEHATGDLSRTDLLEEHGRLDLGGPMLGHQKAGGDPGQGEPRPTPEGVRTRDEGDDQADAESRDPKPERRFTEEGEVKRHPSAERDRKP